MKKWVIWGRIEGFRRGRTRLASRMKNRYHSYACRLGLDQISNVGSLGSDAAVIKPALVDRVAEYVPYGAAVPLAATGCRYDLGVQGSCNSLVACPFASEFECEPHRVGLSLVYDVPPAMPRGT
jgi:hypothetical protein